MSPVGVEVCRIPVTPVGMEVCGVILTPVGVKICGVPCFFGRYLCHWDPHGFVAATIPSLAKKNPGGHLEPHSCPVVWTLGGGSYVLV